MRVHLTHHFKERVDEFKFVYSDPVGGGECTLITFGIRGDDKKYEEAKKYFVK